MAIRFLDKTTAGKPVGGQIGEREIILNLKDGELYSSNDGVDIVQLGAPEKGGIAWATGVDYILGDTVTSDNIAYICLTPHTSAGAFVSANFIPVQQSGRLYNTASVYYAGDLITNGGVAYYAVNDSTVPAGLFVAGDWAVANDEIGGVIWDVGLVYAIGDVVSYNNEVFLCLAPTTAGQIPTGAGAADWANQSSEYGGRAYDANLLYVTGDIVYEVIGAQRALHVKISGAAAGTAPTGISTDTNWQMFAPERGGVLFSLTKAYIDGDIVADAADDIYIHIGGETTGSEPSTSPGVWKKVGSESSNAGTGGQTTSGTDGAPVFDGGNSHTPDPVLNGTSPTIYEYPNTSAESTGAIWTVSGLGAPYLFAAGNLSGTTVANGDTIQWTGGTTSIDPGDGAETWFHKAAPTISAERGGLGWQSAESYAIGDVVTDGLVIYTAVATSNNEQPSANADGAGTDAWKTSIADELGGKAWTDTTDYVVGDVVVDNMVAYLCNADHTSDSAGIPAVDNPDAGGTSWTMIGTPEAGGILHKVAPFVYAIGDTVIGTDGKLFRNLTGTNGALPASNVEASTDWSNDLICDPGHI